MCRGIYVLRGEVCKKKRTRSSYLNFSVVYLGSDSGNACRILFTEIFRYGSFAPVFADEGDAHIFQQFDTVTLLLVDDRIIAPFLSGDEAESFFHIEVLSFLPSE